MPTGQRIEATNVGAQAQQGLVGAARQAGQITHAEALFQFDRQGVVKLIGRWRGPERSFQNRQAAIAFAHHQTGLVDLHRDAYRQHLQLEVDRLNG